MRSPSRAPPLKGLVGSTAIMPIRWSFPRTSFVIWSTIVLLPAPGGPVMPTVYALPVCSSTAFMISAAAGSPRSSNVISLDNVRWSPARSFSVNSDKGQASGLTKRASHAPAREPRSNPASAVNAVKKELGIIPAQKRFRILTRIAAECRANYNCE